MEDYDDGLLYYIGKNRHRLNIKIDNQEVVWNSLDNM